MNKLFYVFAFLTLNLSAVELADVSVAEEPLMKKLSFQTAQMSVRPLVLSDYDAARAVDASDSSFVDIIKADTRALLSTQKRILDGSTEINTLRQNQELSNIYYGAFLKDSDTLIGLIYIHRFHDNPQTKCYLGTDGKYHKAHQGKGYASEVKKALLQHFQDLRIIPAAEGDDTPFLGFKGLINLRNKASLKYNIINCGYKVGRLFGDRVEVYFPFVVERLPYLKDVFITWIDEAGVSSVRTEDSFNSSELLHDSIADFLAQYLSRDAATSVIGEKALRLESLRSLVTAGDDALREENVFVINTLSKSLELLDGDLLTGKLDLIAELYTQSNRELRWMRAFYYFYSPANRRKINDNINNLRIVSSHLGIRNNSWCCFS
ncbi:MAG: GNAT family N-acetyltransferase [Proteobacteria bacterium]|nr:GNAT family N-acetyltransferase [Pseudomonadota bacterium]